MSHENGDGGNGVGTPSEEELNAARAAMFQQAVAESCSQLSAFFPQKTDQELVEAVVRALSTQQSDGMRQFFIDAGDVEQLRKLPGWGVRVKRHGATDASMVGAIIVPVDTDDVRSMDMANQWVSVLAIATSPLARAALDLLGYDLQFVRAKSVPGLVKVHG